MKNADNKSVRGRRRPDAVTWCAISIALLAFAVALSAVASAGSPAPSALTAGVPASALQRLAARRDVASVAAVPVRRPLALSDFVATTGAPNFWAAGYTGGQGTNDNVPATLWIDEDLDTAHPDFH